MLSVLHDLYIDALKNLLHGKLCSFEKTIVFTIRELRQLTCVTAAMKIHVSTYKVGLDDGETAGATGYPSKQYLS